MTDELQPPPPPPSPPTPQGLAIASLVLGIIATTLSFMLIGCMFGLIGLVLGVIFLSKKRRPASMARWGVGLSILGILASIAFATVYYRAYRHFRKLIESANSAQSEGTDITQWKGVTAPDFTVTTIDGQQVTLADLKGKRVLLDFWATWCPPCRKEIPHLNQLFDETDRDTLVLVGISKEDSEKLQDFAKENDIHYPVASAKDLPSPYKDVKSIPTTFLIDRNGVIQSILVGYHDFDHLKREALAEDSKESPKPAPTNAPALTPVPDLPDAPVMLKPTALWSTEVDGAKTLCVGDWEAEGQARVLVAAGSTLHVLDLSGAELETIALPESYSLIECGRNKTGGARLLGYGNWGHKVSIIDRTGKEVFKVSSMSGVDGAHWGDLDGDQTDELVVGMNGGGGLQTWSSDGEKLWSAKLGNVWNQAIVSAGQEQPARVLATEAGGSVRVFDAQGKQLNQLRPNGGYYAQMAGCRRDANAIQIIAIDKGNTVAFDENGTVAWTTSAVVDHTGWRSCNFATGDFDGDQAPDWVFVDGTGALTIATTSGQRLATIADARAVESFAGARRPDQSSLLITLQGDTVQAYAFAP